MGNWLDFLSREAGQRRRAWLDDKSEQFGNALQYYVGPGIDVGNVATVADAFNPVSDIGRAGQSANVLASPDATGRERFNAGVGMVTDMASVLAPVAGARAGGVTAESAGNVLSDALTGVSGSQPAQAGRAFAADEYGGIKAYHGSPHDFDKFSMDKIGTGEGAQAYGHGLYFAENENVARGYRDKLSDPVYNVPGRYSGEDITEDMLPGRAGMLAKSALGQYYERTVDDAIMALENNKRYVVNDDVLPSYDEAIAFLRKADRTADPGAGSMYEVDINANPEDFLDWDAPLSEQSAKVRDSINRVARDVEPYGLDRVADDMRGIEMKRMLQDPKGADALAQTGIPGIRYRDAGSRGVDGVEGTRNYVVFDENLINIVRKYGVAGAATMLGVSAAEVQAAMQEDQGNNALRSIQTPGNGIQ